ncbi:hypothetical protein [Paraburkholderia sp. GAS32]|uniref:arsenate reductase/protein-tyrosine-phosphatase family protein n=1 Tax=Paraburkholderia sp. GAS32 TaxID=3035129 RepID=UPI003D1B0916
MRNIWRWYAGPRKTDSHPEVKQAEMVPDDSGRNFCLLVACTANVCRSPMAQRIFETLITEDRLEAVVVSVGIHGRTGDETHPLARQVLATRGLSSGELRSTRLERRHLKSADLILVMSEAHRIWLIKQYPEVAGRTWLLGHWLGCEIQDPLRGNLAKFQATFELLEKAAKTWMTVLRANCRPSISLLSQQNSFQRDRSV